MPLLSPAWRSRPPRWDPRQPYGCDVGSGFRLALYLPLTMELGYLVSACRTSLRRALPAAALAMGVAFCLGGWWWVQNRLLYGTFQPDRRSLAQPHLVRHTTFHSTDSRWLGEFARLVNQRFWSEPGSVSLPHVLSVTTTLASAQKPQ